MEANWNKIKHLDGILFPGGDGDYYDIGQTVFKYALKQNDEGHFLPIWGTC